MKRTDTVDLNKFIFEIDVYDTSGTIEEGWEEQARLIPYTMSPSMERDFAAEIENFIDRWIARIDKSYNPNETKCNSKWNGSKKAIYFYCIVNTSLNEKKMKILVKLLNTKIEKFVQTDDNIKYIPISPGTPTVRKIK